MICGTDARYGTDASDVVEAARQAGVSQIYLAGPEKAVAEADSKPDDYLTAKIDAVDALSSLLDPIGGLAMTATTGIGSFADIPLHGERSGEPATEAAVAEHVSAAAAAHGYTPDQLDWITPEGIDVKPVYIAADRDAAVAAGYPLDSFPGAAAVRPRALSDDVRQPAVDHPPVRRLLHRGRVQRLLPPQPGRRPEGAVGGVRPGHPPRLRLRSSARAG